MTQQWHIKLALFLAWPIIALVFWPLLVATITLMLVAAWPAIWWGRLVREGNSVKFTWK